MANLLATSHQKSQKPPGSGIDRLTAFLQTTDGNNFVLSPVFGFYTALEVGLGREVSCNG